MKKGYRSSILGIFVFFFLIQNIFADYMVLDWTEDPNSIPAMLFNTLSRYAAQQDTQDGILVDGTTVTVVDSMQESFIICECKVFSQGTILRENLILSDGSILREGTILPRNISGFRAIFDLKKNVFQWSSDRNSIGSILFLAFEPFFSPEEISMEGDYTWMTIGKRKGHILSIQRRETPFIEDMTSNQFRLNIHVRRGIQEVMTMLNKRVEDLKIDTWDCRNIPTETEMFLVGRTFATAYIGSLKHRGLLSISRRELKILFSEVAQSQDWSENFIREVLSDDFFQEMREFLGPARFDVSKFSNLIARRIREVVLFRK